MNTIAHIAKAMQAVLTIQADRWGWKVGFVQRTGKLSGGGFAQILVLGFMAHPQATYEDLSQSAPLVGLSISPQGLEQRFSLEAVELMEQVLNDAVAQVIPSPSATLPILQRFAKPSLKPLAARTCVRWRWVGGSAAAKGLPS